MYKTTAEKQQFYKREGSFSTRPSVRGVNLLGWGSPEILSVPDQVECLRVKIRHIQDRLTNEPLTKEQRKVLGAEHAALSGQIHALQPRKDRPGLGHLILDVVKESVTKRDWDRFVSEAILRWEAKNADHREQSALAPASQPGASDQHRAESTGSGAASAGC